MNQRQQRRLWGLIIISVALLLAVGLILFALRQNINLFYAPTQVVKGEVPVNQMMRLGGLVTKGSVKRQTGLNVFFKVSDLKETVSVHYRGILPDLFREGQGVVMDGRLMQNGIFQASTVLAKHDENYMPPQVQSMLTAQKNKQ